MTAQEKRQLALEVTALLSAGQLEPQSALPAVAALLAGDAPICLASLRDRLAASTEPVVRDLAARIHRQLVAEAARAWQARQSGSATDGAFPQLAHLPLAAPLGWRDDHSLPQAALLLARRRRDQAFASQAVDLDAGARRQLDAAVAAATTDFMAHGARWLYFEPASLGLTAAADVVAANDRLSALRRTLGSAAAAADLRRVALDELLCWPGDEAAECLAALPLQPAEQWRAAEILTYRFGLSTRLTWADWQAWLSARGAQHQERRTACAGIAEAWQQELALVAIESAAAVASEEQQRQLDETVALRAAAVDPDDLVGRLAPRLAASAEQAQPAPRPPVLPRPVPVAAPLEPPPLPRSRPPAPAMPPSPGVWEQALRPLLVGNWYMLTGMFLVVVGASLLAYFTWDRPHLRFTIMPALLAAFTVAQAELGHRLARRHRELGGLGVMLRGGAIVLLPANFAVVCLLARAPGVSGRTVLMILLTLAYLLGFGAALRRWCGQVHAALSLPLVLTLLAANALLAGCGFVALGTADPSARTWVLAAGLYGVTALAAWAVHRTLATAGSAALADDPRACWFLGSVLVVTLVEVAAVAHMTMDVLPRPATYALLCVLVGGEVLRTERWALRRQAAAATYRGESFLGYAVIMLGVLFAFASPGGRVLVWAVAGVVWLGQARRRPGLLHYWFGMVLLLAGGAAIGLLPGFPRRAELNLLPVLGLVLAGALAIVRLMARRFGEERLTAVAIEVQPAVLLLTALVAVLSQWHYRSPPWATATIVLVVAAVFALRACRENRPTWLQTTMALLALALPYLGCAALPGQAPFANRMPLGLGLLSLGWLALCRWRPGPLLLSVRTPVLWAFGGLAFAAMVVRVLFQHRYPVAAADFLGLVLMPVALLWGGWVSRSLLPSVMAAVMLTVLLPGLGSPLPAATWLHWGTGFGSALSALAAIVLCLRLQAWPSLQSLPGGDRLPGGGAVPWQRHDASLATLPLSLAAVVQAAKVCSIIVVHQLATHQAGRFTAVALLLAAIVWTLLAAHLRAGRWAVLLVDLGIAVGFAGVSLGWWLAKRAPEALWPEPCRRLWLALTLASPATPFLVTALLLALACAVYARLQRRRPWVAALLLRPTWRVLTDGSRAGAVVVSALLLVTGVEANWQCLAAVVLGVLVCHCLLARNQGSGALSYVLIGSYLTAVGLGEGWDHVAVADLRTVALGLVWLALAVQLLQTALEWQPAWYAALRPLLRPWQMSSVALIFILASVSIVAIVPGGDAVPIGPGARLALAAAAVLATRANGFGPVLIVGLMQLYFHWLPCLRVPLSVALSRLSWFAGGLAVLPWLGQALTRIWRPLTQGRYPLTMLRLLSPSLWLFGLALPVSSLVAGIHVLLALGSHGQGLTTSQLAAVYLAATCWLLAGAYRPLWGLLAVAGLHLTAANVDLVWTLAGPLLLANGLSLVHVTALGLALTLVQVLAARLASPRLRTSLRLPTLQLAGGMLALLAANYTIHADVSQLTTWRLSISGILALSAGFVFRWEARQALRDGDDAAPRYYGFFHFGVTLALWCLALLLPPLRQPQLTLPALALAPLWFWLCAEFGRDTVAVTRARASAAATALLLVAIYVSRLAFQMLLFPQLALDPDYYHQNSPLSLLLGVLLIRLHGLGGSLWLAFYGGLAIITGAYFAVTAYPGLSPFASPLPAAWAALVLAHFLVLATRRRSPLRTAVQRLGRIDASTWEVLRRGWGRCLAVAVHVVVFLGLLHFRQGSLQTTPLLVACATVMLHQGLINRLRIYWWLAAVELLLALHLDFIQPTDSPALIPATRVVWILLAAWLTLLSVYQWALRRRRQVTQALLAVTTPASAALAVLALAHVLFHGPTSLTGLWTVALVLLLGLVTPVGPSSGRSLGARAAAWLPLLALPWLSYWSQVRAANGDVVALSALVGLGTALLAVGGAGRWWQQHWRERLPGLTIAGTRMWCRTLAVAAGRGEALNHLLLSAVLLLQGGALVGYYQQPPGLESMLASAGLWAWLAWGWFSIGRDRDWLHAHLLAQVAVLGAAATIRRQLWEVPGLWSYEYDVWASLMVSVCLTAAKSAVDRQAAALRRSLLGSVCVLPLLALGWVAVRGLGTDIALVVLGVHSVLFAFMGQGERRSPYNAVAVLGAVLFVFLAFWSRLNLRFVHAYTIPAGLGTLGLLHLFGDRLRVETRNGIRLVTLMIMLGSSGWYALTSPGYALGFHLVMILLSLACMGLGGLLQVRLYLAMGCTGVVVDVGALSWRLAANLEHTHWMMIAGLCLLLLGGALVGGAAYVKTHREMLQAAGASLRRRFQSWE